MFYQGYNKNVDWVYKLKNINNIYIYDKEKPENKYDIPVNKGMKHKYILNILLIIMII